MKFCGIRWINIDTKVLFGLPQARRHRRNAAKNVDCNAKLNFIDYDRFWNVQFTNLRSFSSSSLLGPVTVPMVSQSGSPPIPMPHVQVPPGHVMQQIVDENGTLRHVILSTHHQQIQGSGHHIPHYVSLCISLLSFLCWICKHIIKGLSFLCVMKYDSCNKVYSRPSARQRTLEHYALFA